MNEKLLLGKPVAEYLLQQAREHLRELSAKTGEFPRFLNVLVGADDASQIYSQRLMTRCKELQIRAEMQLFPTETTTAKLVQNIQEWNHENDLHAVLLQHPFPKQIQEQEIFETLHFQKDVDGVSPTNFGRVALGASGHTACTPLGILHLLKYYQVPLEGKEAVVVGRSAILGKPMAMLLLAENATVTICHSRTQNLAEVVSRADIVVAAVGKAHLIRGHWLKSGAVVVDAGYTEGKGDVNFEEALPHISKITPVPGGVGPITIATLITQIVQAFAWQKGIPLQKQG